MGASTHDSKDAEHNGGAGAVEAPNRGKGKFPEVGEAIGFPDLRLSLAMQPCNPV
jgi:hypothetical protein